MSKLSVLSSGSRRSRHSKGEGKGLPTCYVAALQSWTTLGSCSWLAWASGTAAHFVAIGCLWIVIAKNWTRGAARQIYHRPNQPH